MWHVVIHIHNVEGGGGRRERGRRRQKDTFQQSRCLPQLTEGHNHKEGCVVSGQRLWFCGTLIVDNYLHIVTILGRERDRIIR